jgi:hypothetical protein
MATGITTAAQRQAIPESSKVGRGYTRLRFRPRVAFRSMKYLRTNLSSMAFLNLRGHLGVFVSAHEIPFPGNGDFGSKRRSSNPQLLSGKTGARRI